MEEAIKIYRDTFRLNLKAGFKEDIVSTVRDLPLWKTILTEWKEHKWNPLRVNWMLSEYERREKFPQRCNATARSERSSETEPVPLGVSEWRSSNLSCVQEGAGVQLRASGKTLEEIVTEALRQNNRSEAEVKP